LKVDDDEEEKKHEELKKDIQIDISPLVKKFNVTKKKVMKLDKSKIKIDSFSPI
jgi:hypothetical protein